jgi:hypothetical protein
MFGKSVVKVRQWYCDQNNETLYTFPDDEKIIAGCWKKGRKWRLPY